MARAVFLDRDGVLNRKAPEGRYIADLQQFEILPGALEAVARLRRSGFLVFVVTNQRGIARHIVSPKAVEGMHQYLLNEAKQVGGSIDKIYVCPHDDSDGCDCRKPMPGMLLRAAQEHSVDLTKSWMVGDSVSDLEAGRSAGCKTAFVGSEVCRAADLSMPSLEELVDLIVGA